MELIRQIRQRFSSEGRVIRQRQTRTRLKTTVRTIGHALRTPASFEERNIKL